MNFLHFRSGGNRVGQEICDTRASKRWKDPLLDSALHRVNPALVWTLTVATALLPIFSGCNGSSVEGKSGLKNAGPCGDAECMAQTTGKDVVDSTNYNPNPTGTKPGTDTAEGPQIAPGVPLPSKDTVDTGSVDTAKAPDSIVTKPDTSAADAVDTGKDVGASTVDAISTPDAGADSLVPIIPADVSKDTAETHGVDVAVVDGVIGDTQTKDTKAKDATVDAQDTSSVDGNEKDVTNADADGIIWDAGFGTDTTGTMQDIKYGYDVPGLVDAGAEAEAMAQDAGTKQCTLASGIVDKGNTLYFAEYKLKFDDIDIASGKNYALFTISEAATDTQKTKMKISEGTTEYVTLDGKTYSITVNEAAFGATYSATWANVAISSACAAKADAGQDYPTSSDAGAKDVGTKKDTSLKDVKGSEVGVDAVAETSGTDTNGLDTGAETTANGSDVNNATADVQSQWTTWRGCATVNVSGSGIYKLIFDAANTSYVKFNTDGSDLRVVDGACETLDNNAEAQAHWIQNWNPSGTSVVWVNAKNPNAQAVSVLYAKPGATTTSDISKVFAFGDDFNGNALDTTKWTVHSWFDSLQLKVEDGALTASGLPKGYNTLESTMTTTSDKGYTIEMEFTMQEGSMVGPGTMVHANFSDKADDKVIVGYNSTFGFLLHAYDSGSWNVINAQPFSANLGESYRQVHTWDGTVHFGELYDASGALVATVSGEYQNITSGKAGIEVDATVTSIAHFFIRPTGITVVDVSAP